MIYAMVAMVGKSSLEESVATLNHLKPSSILCMDGSARQRINT